MIFPNTQEGNELCFIYDKLWILPRIYVRATFR